MNKHQYRISRDAKEYSIGGKEYTFARFTRRIWESVSDYGSKRIPNPVEVALSVVDKAVAKDQQVIRQLEADDAREETKAKAEKRPPVLLAERYTPLAATLWDRALMVANRYLHAGSPELQGLIGSIEGESYLFDVLLSVHHPDLGDQDKFDIYMDLRINGGADGRKTVKDILDICSGRAPEPAKNAESPA